MIATRSAVSQEHIARIAELTGCNAMVAHEALMISDGNLDAAVAYVLESAGRT
jgi:hypothetical protein